MRKRNKILAIVAVVLISVIAAGFIPVPISARVLSGTGTIPPELRTFFDWNFGNFSFTMRNTTVSVTISGNNYTFVSGSMDVKFEIASSSETRGSSTDWFRRGYFNLDMRDCSIVSSQLSATFGEVSCRLNFETYGNGTSVMYYVDGTVYIPFWAGLYQYIQNSSPSPSIPHS